MALQCAHVTVMKLWMHKPSQENVSHTNTQRTGLQAKHIHRTHCSLLHEKSHLTKLNLCWRLPHPLHILYLKITTGKTRVESTSCPQNKQISQFLTVVKLLQLRNVFSSLLMVRLPWTHTCVGRGIILVTIYCSKTNQTPQQLTETSLLHSSSTLVIHRITWDKKTGKDRITAVGGG